MDWKPRGLAVVPTEEWEQDGLRNFTSTAEPIGGGEWRLWYYARTDNRQVSHIAVAEGQPGSRSMRKYRLERSASERPVAGVAYTLSNLPEGWQPAQAVYLRVGPTTHFLYFWAHAPGVVRYLRAESSDGHHFVVPDPRQPVLWHYHDRAVASGMLAAEGLTLWGRAEQQRPADEPEAVPHLICNDATNVHLLPDGGFELFSAHILPIEKESDRFIAEDNAAGFVRVIDRWESPDGFEFKNRQRVLAPDGNDPPGLQFYYLSATVLKGTKRHGFAGHYRADLQMLTMEEVESEDGIHWDRPSRCSTIGAGFQGDHDKFGTLSGHEIVRHDNRWWCFYTGLRHTHNFGKSELPSATILFATSE